MAVIARVQCGNRSFVLKVTPEAPSGYLAQVWDEQKQANAAGFANNKTLEGAKREAEVALRAYLKSQRLDCPDLLNWTEL
jgi:hypothetical protein